MDKTWIKKIDNETNVEDKILTTEEMKLYSEILVQKEAEFKEKEKKIADAMYEGLIEEKN